MDTNKMREQFEAAFIEKCAADLGGKVPGITRESAIKFIRCNWLARSGDNYELPVPNAAWWSWRASREAVVVKLPIDVSGGLYRLALEDCARCIEAQGLKVTP
ncbi:hypothetical protein [Pseudomonas juntendi]|uniref:Uncharacterized protein n=1 Tax=Pseudomonas juntendi TaxID=2666183 RepID=A0AAJ5UZ57_9PSED|nr:hypothetical protein [Pseudomonas juntendi]WEA19081.1 hypothetical protein PWA60_17490 [Pseudomonas juntendi]